VALAPSGAGAADATASAWWNKLQAGEPVTVPAPPGVEEGQLLVQGSLDGASAMAAVRFALTAEETAPVLQLRFAQDGAGDTASTAVVLACPASTPWSPGDNQAWATKPVPDCNKQAVGEVADDGASMIFDLSSFAVGDTVDLVIVPGTVEGLPQGANGSSFSLVFEAPEDTDLVTQVAGAPITAPATTGGSSAAPAGATAPAASSGGGAVASGGAVSRPPTPSFQPPATPAAPALPPAEVAAPVAGSVAPFQPASTTDSSGAKTLAVVLLLGAAGATLLASRRGPLLQLLGGVPATPAPAVAGLGRFAREREGAPPTLR
jgi:hypothetical protein